MKKRLASWLLYKVMGWQTRLFRPLPQKVVVCVAPHTSNWDFIICQLFVAAEGIEISFLMKKEWFFWPLGGLFRRMGGIAVDRDKHLHLTDVLAERAARSAVFRICITPEGTRSCAPYWKAGFYFVAEKAKMPILLCGLDYEKRLLQCTETIVPGDDADRDFRAIKRYFKQFTGKHPNRFSTGDA